MLLREPHKILKKNLYRILIEMVISDFVLCKTLHQTINYIKTEI